MRRVISDGFWLRLTAMIVALLVAPSLVAMPTTAEREKIRPVVNELVADDLSALKAGKATRAEVAEKCLVFAGEAETAAAKCELLHLAFRQYMSGGSFDRAAEVFGRLEEAVGDVPDGELAAWSAEFMPQVCKRGRADGIVPLLSLALSTGDGKSAALLAKQAGLFRAKLKKSDAWSKLEALLEQVTSAEETQREIRRLRTALRQASDDATLREKLGVALATVDDWPAALEEFSKASGKVAEVAVWEGKYPETGLSDLTAAAVAEFWWTYLDAAKPSEQATDSFRRHATKWYRTALENDSLKGLRKTLAEKRIKEVETTRRPVETVRTKEETPVATTDSKTKDASVPRPIVLKLDVKTQMTFMGCPAGEFEMGYPEAEEKQRPSHKAHRVVITRPFWLAKTPMTLGQVCALEGKQVEKAFVGTPLEIDYFLGGVDVPMQRVSWGDIEDYCAQLTKKFRSKLPRGYVFRLPTMAEWEYACRANSTDPNDPYARIEFGSDFLAACRPVGVLLDEIEEVARKKGFVKTDQKGIVTHPAFRNIKIALSMKCLACGRKKANAWGLCDMIGNCNEMLLDRVPAKNLAAIPDEKMSSHRKVIDWQYVSGAKDPVFVTDDEGPTWLFYPSRWHWAVDYPFTLDPLRPLMSGFGFRLAIGPDLLKERKAKKR